MSLQTTMASYKFVIMEDVWCAAYSLVYSDYCSVVSD